MIDYVDSPIMVDVPIKIVQLVQQTKVTKLFQETHVVVQRTKKR
jgi:hypothetical protein